MEDNITKEIRREFDLKSIIIPLLILIIVISVSGSHEITRLRNELDDKNSLLKEIGFDVELNNCPNCDSEVSISVSEHFFYIECDGCDTYCGYYPYNSIDRLFERWNSGNIEDEVD